MEAVAEVDGFDMNRFTPLYCELNSFQSVREFCDKVDEFRLSKPIDRLVCNAGVYQPSLPYAKWSIDNHEQTMQINYLSHFLMISKLLPGLQDSNDPRVIMVGSVTGNDNTVGGGGVYPIADLHELDGFKAGFKNPISMADGYGFIGAKAYKDSKLCLMMMANLLHTKYHKLTRISFSSMYPGCIAESPLFREKREWFRKYFPIFMKFITGGFVSEHEAGQRLFQVVHDPRCAKSGVYWSWNGGPREGRGLEAIEKGGQISGGGGAGGGWDSIFENDQSAKVLDVEKSVHLFDYSTNITGAVWPDLKAVTSPCPTLKVIGAVTKGMVQREELKRIREMGRPGMDGSGTVLVPVVPDLVQAAHTNEVMPVTVKPIKITARKRVAIVADKVVSFTLGNTIGRVAKLAGKRILGEFPEEAIQGSYAPTAADLASTKVQNNNPAEQNNLESIMMNEEDQKELMDEVVQQLGKPVIDAEDEALFRNLYNGERSSTPSLTAPKEATTVAV
jgi:light-dependent protochlorophyllide reductase